MGRLQGARRRVRNFLDGWGPAIILGVFVAAVVWTVWYISKVACIPAAADAGLCNPGIIANYINVDILIKAGSSGAATTALKGGYDKYMMRDMLKREQAARQSAEERLVKKQAEADEARAELAEARKEAEAARRQAQDRAEAAQQQAQERAEAAQQQAQERAEAAQQQAQDRAEAAQQQAAAAQQRAQERAEAAQQQAAAAQQQAQERAEAAQQQAFDAIARANQRADEYYGTVAELVRDFRAERQQAEEERRRQAATQQAILETMLELLRRQVNGERPAGNDDGAGGQG